MQAEAFARVERFRNLEVRRPETRIQLLTVFNIFFGTQPLDLATKRLLFPFKESPFRDFSWLNSESGDSISQDS